MATNLTLKLAMSLGQPVVEVHADNYEGMPIGHFSADGQWLYRDEQVPDYDDAVETVREQAMAMLAAS